MAAGRGSSGREPPGGAVGAARRGDGCTCVAQEAVVPKCTSAVGRGVGAHAASQAMCTAAQRCFLCLLLEVLGGGLPAFWHGTMRRCSAATTRHARSRARFRPLHTHVYRAWAGLTSTRASCVQMRRMAAAAPANNNGSPDVAAGSQGCQMLHPWGRGPPASQRPAVSSENWAAEKHLFQANNTTEYKQR